MTSVRRTIGVLVFLLTIVVTISFSQSPDAQNNDGGYSSKLMQVNFINEAALYYYAPLGARMNLRTGFSINWNYDEAKDGTTDYHENYPYSPNRTGTSHFGNTRNNYAVNLSSLAMYEIMDYEYLQAYAGAGPMVTYSYYKYSNSNSQITDSTSFKSSYSSVTPSWGVGPALSLLLKCKLYGRLSVASEYAFSAIHYWQTERYSSYQEDRYTVSNLGSSSGSERTSKSNGWRLNLGNIRIGLLIAL